MFVIRKKISGEPRFATGKYPSVKTGSPRITWGRKFDALGFASRDEAEDWKAETPDDGRVVPL